MVHNEVRTISEMDAMQRLALGGGPENIFGLLGLFKESSIFYYWPLSWSKNQRPKVRRASLKNHMYQGSKVMYQPHSPQ